MIRFGTGGWRAVIGDDFTKENVMTVAAGIARLAAEENKTELPVIIGYDRRFLSDSAAVWTAETLCGFGLKVIFMKRSVPTPLVMHTVLRRPLHYGIEITASHNPAAYNGMKLIVEEGRDAPVETTSRLEQLMAQVETERDAGVPVPFVPFSEAVAAGLVEFAKNPFNSFIDDILAVLDTAAVRERGLRMLFNPMHGSGTYPLMTVFYTTRCTIDLINYNKDAYFGGHMPAPNEQTLLDFAEKVVEGGYDLGIALDGDGDRLGIIDANGRYVSANDILVLLYYYLHEYKGWRGPVVRNMSTTHKLDAVAADLGEICYEVPVGFKYISSKIDEVDAVLGGESSGGLTVRGHIHGKDSIYAAALFVEMICVTGKSPSEMIEELNARYGDYVMVEKNVRFDPEKRGEYSRRLFEDRDVPVFSKDIKRVGYDDGCKVYFADNSFVSCRFSGTEPLLRVFAEASDRAAAEGYIAKFSEMLGI